MARHAWAASVASCPDFGLTIPLEVTDMVRSTSRQRRALLVLAGAGLMALSSAAPVAATIFAGGHYAGTDAWTYDDCGPTVVVTAEYGGVFRVRTGKGADASAFFMMDNYWYREIHRRESDGKAAVIWGDGVYNETRATNVGGSVFEFRTINAGAPFTMSDGDGNVLFRDRGTITQTFLFDTLGDLTPGGQFVAPIDLQTHGQFPGFEADLCEYWNQ